MSTYVDGQLATTRDVQAASLQASQAPRGSGYWYDSIGSKIAYGGGVPGPSQTVKVVELHVKRP